jgi:hypothetical protein
MIEEELEPFKAKFSQYLKAGNLREAQLFCMGIIEGLYQFEYESNSEFKDWAPDIANSIATEILNNWKKSCNDNGKLNEVEEYISENCPEWSNG